MYPSSTSSSSQGSMGSSSGGGLMRYGSAPSSLLTTAVDSVIGATREFSARGTQNHLGPARFFPSETSESIAMANQNDSVSRSNNPSREEASKANTRIGLQPSFGFGGGGASSSLVRHSSSPAGFLNQLATAAGGDNNAGFSITRGIRSHNSKGIATTVAVYQETENVDGGIGTNNGQRKSTNSYASAGFGMGSWDLTHPMMFSVAPGNRAKTITTGDVVNGLDTMESQFQFSMSQTALEMTSMEKLLNIPHDSVPCKIRAKRGCATHPRSVAERERRTRISGKLKKLQDLVPNMDKQTSYADMLDLAVQHIKSLQNQVQVSKHYFAFWCCYIL
ncbi:hypothetical protein Pfo_016376 [Paulownia fortunei]|nr:hypothetical protein Pfo_016376 [Paulownia fortunei]